MSGAHKITWWGALDPYTFGVWISEDKIYDFSDPYGIDPLFLRSLVEPPQDDHAAFLGHLGTSAERVSAITAFSVYAHEWRHWYDSTSTPWGLYRYGQLAAFYATLVSIEDELNELDRIFVPMAKWRRSPDIVNAAYGLRPLPPPVTTVMDAALGVLAKAEHSLLAAETVAGRRVSTSQILEGLAMLQQELLVDQHFGSDAAAELRVSVKNTAGGQAYYDAVEAVEHAFGGSRETTIAVLEGTLFGDYGVLGSALSPTPPLLLNAFLSAKVDAEDKDPDDLLDDVLRDHQGFKRPAAFDHAYEAMTTMLEKLAAAAERTPSGGSAQRVRAGLASALKAAVFWSSIARYRDKFDDIPDDFGPSPDPYALPAPLFIEGNPGRVSPSSVEEGPFRMLAGWQLPRWALDQMFPGQERDSPESDEMYTQTVVWTPIPGARPDSAAAASPSAASDHGVGPPYFALLNLFQDLMYWRALTFGPGSISPFTFAATTAAYAASLGQELVGPQVRML